MKKILSVVLFAALFLALGVNSLAAENAGISFSTSGPDENGSVFVDVVLSGDGEPAMLQFCVAYDSEKLECVSAVAGSAFSGSSVPTINAVEGKIYFAWDSINPLKGGGILLKIEFLQKDKSENAFVWIDESEETLVIDENFEEIGVIGEKAEIKGTGNSEGESSAIPEESGSSGTEENSESPDNSGENGTQSVPDAETGCTGGIEIEKTRLTIRLGEETTIGISGTDEKVFWYSSNEGVVRVEDGKIIPVAPGTATVTVMTEDGLCEAACVVTVADETEAEASSGKESADEVINVDSPREEKKNSVPGWGWAIIVLLIVTVGGGIVLLAKKTMGANKKE